MSLKSSRTGVIRFCCYRTSELRKRFVDKLFQVSLGSFFQRERLYQVVYIFVSFGCQRFHCQGLALPVDYRLHIFVSFGCQRFHCQEGLALPTSALASKRRTATQHCTQCSRCWESRHTVRKRSTLFRGLFLPGCLYLALYAVLLYVLRPHPAMMCSCEFGSEPPNASALA